MTPPACAILKAASATEVRWAGKPKLSWASGRDGTYHSYALSRKRSSAVWQTEIVAQALQHEAANIWGITVTVHLIAPSRCVAALALLRLWPALAGAKPSPGQAAWR